VKPSERIGVIRQELLETFNEQNREAIEDNAVSRVQLLLRALGAYLDERHEREEQLARALTLTLAVLAGRLYQKQPGDVDIGPAPGAPPDLPPRVAELLKELTAYPRRNWSIPEPADYCEALFQWLEEGARG
jgi:hypothetical protein